MVVGWVRGRRVSVVGKWPPREKVVRWRRSWPCRDLGSDVTEQRQYRITFF